MRPALLISASVLILTSALGAPTSGDITVEFLEPDTYRDFKKSQHGGEKERDYLQNVFRKEIVSVAERYLPPGNKLTLRFRDIDMAGDFEPQLGPNYNDVRIIRAIYPPSFEIDYQVTDEGGNVLAAGSRRITDLAFQNTVSFRKDEELFYEVELVRDLIREITRNL